MLDDDDRSADASLVERVARAACEAGNHAPWPTSDGYTDRDEKRAWYKIAHAVIAEMRNPTPKMLDVFEDGRPDLLTWADVWAAAIDAELSAEGAVPIPSTKSE